MGPVFCTNFLSLVMLICGLWTADSSIYNFESQMKLISSPASPLLEISCRPWHGTLDMFQYSMLSVLTAWRTKLNPDHDRQKRWPSSAYPINNGALHWSRHGSESCWWNQGQGLEWASGGGGEWRGSPCASSCGCFTSLLKTTPSGATMS